jgi:hypothetical protein
VVIIHLLTLQFFFDILAFGMTQLRHSFCISIQVRDNFMQQLPIKEETERDYQAGYNRVIQFANYARKQGWRLSDRQLVHEIVQRERAAQIREKSSLPILGPGVRSAAYNRGQADALREILWEQRVKR